MLGDPLGRLRDAATDLDRVHLAALAVVGLAGLAVWLLATELFPYHSSNDDEGVYLLQAAMLLEGQLTLRAGDLAEAFRPWFFVADGGRLYAKYAPVTPAMYAVSMALFDEPRVTLVAVAAGNAALVYALGSMVFDRRVGVVAAAIFAAAPMTLLASAVFLPYAPTTLLNLLFALAYLRGVRRDRLRDAALAGGAIGLSFFARPYTAILFAAPFVVHAGWSVLRELRDSQWKSDVPDPVVRNLVTGAAGLAFVGLVLAYNARLTGDPLTFPYQAFAPRDGPGFGHRRLLDYAIEYTPRIALEANAAAIWYLGTRWFTAGPLGTIAALTGLVVALRRWLPTRWAERNGNETDSDRTAGLLLAGLFVSVSLGNLAFWGNYNVHAGIADPTTGLLSKFGPFYHFDLLVPLSIFAAFAVVAGWRRGRTAAIRTRLAAASPQAARVVGLVLVLTAALGAGAVDAALLSDPIERNAAHTERFESAYEPFEDRDLENALVFLPTPYGQWQGHPFQALRNDDGLDGEVVFALDGPPGRDFAVLDAYPDRTVYRYSYRGEWTATPDDEITARLGELSVRRGDRLDGETTVGIANRVDRAFVRLENADDVSEYTVADPDDELSVEWALEARSGDGGVARLNGTPNETVSFEDTDELVLTITQVQPEGATHTYRQEVTVRATDDGVEAIWPPERTACPLVTDCGTDGTYLPDRPNTRSEWEYFETRLEDG